MRIALPLSADHTCTLIIKDHGKRLPIHTLVVKIQHFTAILEVFIQLSLLHPVHRTSLVITMQLVAQVHAQVPFPLSSPLSSLSFFG